MAKVVQRTIKTYNHTFLRMLEGGEVEKAEVVQAEKMGARKAAAYTVEHDMPGFVLANVEETEDTYEMPIEVFMANAVKV